MHCQTLSLATRRERWSHKEGSRWTALCGVDGGDPADSGVAERVGGWGATAQCSRGDRGSVEGAGFWICGGSECEDAEFRCAGAVECAVRQRGLGHAGVFADARFLFTGQRPLTHGVFINDVPLDPEGGDDWKDVAGGKLRDGFIGKWHVDGHGRLSFIPPERRQGVRLLEGVRMHAQLHGLDLLRRLPEKAHWSGYDAIDQTKDAVQYLRDHAKSEKPFVLFLAWGPPHDPYLTAPEQYRALYRPDTLQLRANVPAAQVEQTRKYLAGYYAHCSALDDCMGQIRAALDETGLAENTVLVFTADHGDMLGSQGLYKKQKPYDESIRVPLLFHWPRGLGTTPRELDAPTNSEDLMPTLLGLCGAPIPKSVEGLDYSGYLRGGNNPGDGATVILCAAPFGEWDRRKGGKEYRGVRTTRYTYVRDLQGPWLLFDDQEDPLQMRNLIGDAAHAPLQAEMEALLSRKLRERGDAFLPGEDYIKKWGWKVDANGTAATAPVMGLGEMRNDEMKNEK